MSSDTPEGIRSTCRSLAAFVESRSSELSGPLMSLRVVELVALSIARAARQAQEERVPKHVKRAAEVRANEQVVARAEAGAHKLAAALLDTADKMAAPGPSRSGEETGA